MGKEYETLVTFDETVNALDHIRSLVTENGLSNFPDLERRLAEAQLGARIPNPGFVLNDIAYNTTSKFEMSGDRDLTQEEGRRFSGLDDEGYNRWTTEIFPAYAQAQIDFCRERNILNIDGKGECVAYQRKPVITDFGCTIDENRLMIPVSQAGVEWAIPSNKEIQRAIFKQAGVDIAIGEAKHRAEQAGDVNAWKDYMPQALQERRIDLRAVAEHSCNLMSYAVAEIGNRTLGKLVFDAKPLDSWAPAFMQYARRIERQV